MAMNGISYGTSNSGMPRLAAASTSAFGTRLCSNPVPTPRPATSRSASRSQNRRWRAGELSWMLVVRSSSPPDSQGVGSSSSEMCTHRIGRSAPSPPAISSRPQSETRLATVSIVTALLVEPLPGLGQHGPQDVLDLLELLRVADQRWSELDHRIAPI